jgi:hypothetical protein
MQRIETVHHDSQEIGGSQGKKIYSSEEQVRDLVREKEGRGWVAKKVGRTRERKDPPFLTE